MAVILAADHNKAVNTTVARPLAYLGHHVFTATKVDTALHWLEEAEKLPDLVIVDVGVREFGGLEFIKMLKSDRRWWDIPVLVQSMSHTMEFYQLCEGILMKPYWRSISLAMWGSCFLAG